MLQRTFTTYSMVPDRRLEGKDMLGIRKTRKDLQLHFAPMAMDLISLNPFLLVKPKSQDVLGKRRHKSMDMNMNRTKKDG